ncbi:MAG: hypothetical protein ABIE22_02660 [archaeon]
MKKKVIMLSLILAIVIVLILLTLSLTSPQFSPSTGLEDCKTISYNGKNKINIVFFSNEKQAKDYSEYFLTISPFNKNKGSFNFFYIDSYIPECEIYKGIALLCHSKEIIKKAASCPNDYIVVIQDQPKKIRSSAYMNVMSLNANYPKSVFPHEFGHAFLTLAEEYVPASLPDKPKNCVDNCEKFSQSDGCFEGCSESLYFRSINAGIMRTLSSESFGLFNEQLFQEKFQSTSKVTALAIENTAECEDQKYYLIKGQIIDDKITISEKSIQVGCVGGNGAGVFSFNITTTTGKTTQGNEFNPEDIFTDLYEEELSGEVLLAQTFILKMPLVENGKNAELFKQDHKIFDINLEEINSRPCKK